MTKIFFEEEEDLDEFAYDLAYNPCDVTGVEPTEEEQADIISQRGMSVEDIYGRKIEYDSSNHCSDDISVDEQVEDLITTCENNYESSYQSFGNLS